MRKRKDRSKGKPEKTDFGPGKTPLYYNNVGLFSERTLIEHFYSENVISSSSGGGKKNINEDSKKFNNQGLFSDPFLDRLEEVESHSYTQSTDFLNKFWNIDEFDASKYNKAFQDIVDIWDALDQDIEAYCENEAQLEEEWIKPIFQAIGWEYDVQSRISRNGSTNFPDYALYRNKEDWKKSKKLSGNKKFKNALAIADAKGLGINLDGKGFSNKNPSFQIINYLKQTDKSWGILTDGQYWRIYSVRSESKHTTYFEIDLVKILEAEDFERFIPVLIEFSCADQLKIIRY